MPYDFFCRCMQALHAGIMYQIIWVGTECIKDLIAAYMPGASTPTSILHVLLKIMELRSPNVSPLHRTYPLRSPEG